MFVFILTANPHMCTYIGTYVSKHIGNYVGSHIVSYIRTHIRYYMGSYIVFHMHDVYVHMWGFAVGISFVFILTQI